MAAPVCLQRSSRQACDGIVRRRLEVDSSIGVWRRTEPREGLLSSLAFDTLIGVR